MADQPFGAAGGPAAGDVDDHVGDDDHLDHHDDLDDARGAGSPAYPLPQPGR